ncbi:long-chain fatty acid--CoA ligase [Nocardia yamanashiensis]|uniref:AMP-dependent synthetase/ligase n=1 Tax=Nocardia yamanashiensis TaxID=209247 RepID=UPI001E522BAB|nr:long-chain fatty acid--CoA ligase [Nocardia yamanashiensis]UGT38845.1 long-chain fatty acid--CoA ligase [Nocardia yamanashiensis]
MIPPRTTTPRTLTEAFRATAAAEPDAIALRTPGNAVTITWREYAERVRTIASGLAGLGVGAGDTVALMLTNRPEFHLCDTAVLHVGATPFSIYNTNPAETIAFLFDNADNRVVICEKQFLPVIFDAMRLGGKVEHVVCVDGVAKGALSLEAVEAAPSPGFDADAVGLAVRPDDVLTVIYTSGTTGDPKGVEITHRNVLENLGVIAEFGAVGSADRVISYLPDAHGANRWFAHWLNLRHGVQITTLDDAKGVLAALTEVRPTLFLGVPRVWTKARAGIYGAVAAESNPVKRAVAQWALRVGVQRARAEAAGHAPSRADSVRYRIAKRAVLDGIRERLGMDRVRIAVTGAAPIPTEVHEFVLALGIELYEAYGQSEATAVITVNRKGRTRPGTVGTAAPGVEVRLADDGEVLARSASVMRGYRKDPEQTRDTVDAAGWLHTGDVGAFDQDGYLRIIDRKKEIIINQAGKNMSPTKIENAVAAHCSLAGPVAVIGEGRVYNTLLVTLDPDAAAAFVQRLGLAPRGLADLARDPLVRKEIEEGIAAANATLARVEQIKRFTILPVAWEPGGTELTPKMSLKRKPLAAKYAAEIEALYAPTETLEDTDVHTLP